LSEPHKVSQHPEMHSKNPFDSDKLKSRKFFQFCRAEISENFKCHAIVILLKLLLPNLNERGGYLHDMLHFSFKKLRTTLAPEFCTFAGDDR
jgi:hypothetical protein